MDSGTLLIIGVALLGMVFCFTTIKYNHNRLKKEGFSLKDRVFVHNYLGGHPDMSMPQKLTIICPKGNSLFILFYPDGNFIKQAEIGGEIPFSFIVNIFEEEPANFLIIEWKKEEVIHRTTFQFSVAATNALATTRKKLLDIVRN